MVFSLPVIKENGIIELSCEEKLMREKRDILGEEKKPTHKDICIQQLFSIFSECAWYIWYKWGIA